MSNAKLKIILENFPRRDVRYARPNDHFSYSDGINFLFQKTDHEWLLDTIEDLFFVNKRLIESDTYYNIKISTTQNAPGVLFTLLDRKDKIVFTKTFINEFFIFSLTLKFIDNVLMLPSEI